MDADVEPEAPILDAVASELEAVVVLEALVLEAVVLEVMVLDEAGLEAEALEAAVLALAALDATVVVKSSH